MDVMAESAGGAMEEMEIIYDSLDYKINRLSETGTGIAQNLFAREDMKSVIDGLTSILELIDSITDSLGLFGSLSVVSAGIGGIFGAKGSGLTNYVTSHSLQVPF